MFKYLKNDKITKSVGKARTTINEEMRKNEINFLEAHLKMEKEIQSIYDSNNFSYQDLIKRKKHLKDFNDNLKNILISLVFGIIASIIFDFIKSTISEDLTTNINNDLFVMLIYIIFLVVFFIAIALGMVYLILKFSQQISSNDKLNTNDYELDIIKEKLKEYECNHKK